MRDTMLTIDHLPAQLAVNDLRGREEDTLLMTWEQRRWLRGKFSTAKGREIAIALPTGTVVAPGAILFASQDWYLRVHAAAEPVLAVTPAGYADAVRIAFEVGNRHFPLAMLANDLLVPDDTAMVQLLERLGARWDRRSEIFNPLGNAHRHEH